jgi:uncharacterized LabA/DUF88 family protein
MNNLKKLNREIVYVFIDASNLWEAQKSKGKLFDYEKLQKFLKNRFKAQEIKIFYYTAYPANGTRNYDTNSRHKFYTFLKKGLGFVVRKKELKRITITTEEGQIIEEKGNMDVEMAIDVLHFVKKYNIAVFFTGDSDFLALVTYLRNSSKKVYIFSSENNASKELKTGGDGYCDVLKIKENIWGKELKHRDDKKRDFK